MLNDNQRAAIIAVVGNVITALVLFQIVDWSGEQVAILTSIVNGTLTALALIFKSSTPVPVPDTITITTQPPPTDPAP